MRKPCHADCHCGGRQRPESGFQPGKGNPDFNYSAPHGAGRIMSRRAAKDSINLDDYVNSMKGIHSSTVNSSTIDEAPFAYKPISSIIENTKETVDIIKIIKPIYNFKASDVTD